MLRIDWETFFGSSSTEEALAYFAKNKKYDFNQFLKDCSYYKDCKQEIYKMKHKSYKKSRRSACEALNRRGYLLSDFCTCHLDCKC